MPDPATAFVVRQPDGLRRLPDYLRNLLGYLAALTPRVALACPEASGPLYEPLGPGVRVAATAPGADRFAAYRAGIDALGSLDGLQRLVLLDAGLYVMHPHVLCERALAAAPEAAIVGLTACSQPQPHLQPYWLEMRRPALLTEAFGLWRRGIDLAAGDAPEFDLSRRFGAAGLKLAVAFRPSRAQSVVALCRALDCGIAELALPGDGPANLDPGQVDQLDPTAFCWDGLLDAFGVFRIELAASPAPRAGGANLARLHHWMAGGGPEAAMARDALDGFGFAAGGVS